MREIKGIIEHCTATQQVNRLMPFYRTWIEENNWKFSEGYHVVIFPDGTESRLAGDELIVNGARGYNRDYLHMAYVGGLKGDDRTPEQKEAIKRRREIWRALYNIPEDKILPHYAVDKRKKCPWYDPIDEIDAPATGREAQNRILKQIDLIEPLFLHNMKLDFPIEEKAREEAIEVLYELTRVIDKKETRSNLGNEIADCIITMMQVYKKLELKGEEPLEEKIRKTVKRVLK